MIFNIFFSIVSAESKCFDQPCPPGTTNCKRHMKTSGDKQFLDVTISCLNDYGNYIIIVFIYLKLDNLISLWHPNLHYMIGYMKEMLQQPMKIVSAHAEIEIYI